MALTRPSQQYWKKGTWRIDATCQLTIAEHRRVVATRRSDTLLCPVTNGVRTSNPVDYLADRVLAFIAALLPGLDRNRSKVRVQSEALVRL